MASRPESSVKISASHAEKLCVTLLPKLCSETDLGEFCKLVAGVGFTPHDQEKVYAAVASRCEAIAHDSVRCANVRQDWDFRDHLPAHIWTALPSDSGHTQLLSFLKSLGMWNPAEPILQLVSGILMISTDQAHLSDSAKNQHLKCVKSWWQKIKGKDIAPTPYLDILPDIHKLKSRFPLLIGKQTMTLHQPPRQQLCLLRLLQQQSQASIPSRTSSLQRRWSWEQSKAATMPKRKSRRF